MHYASPVRRLVAFAAALSVSTVLVCETTNISFETVKPTSLSAATIA